MTEKVVCESRWHAIGATRAQPVCLECEPATPRVQVDREALVQLLDDYAVGRYLPENAAEYRGNIINAVLALLSSSGEGGK